VKTELICTGYFYADGGAMFGTIPKTTWQRQYKANDKNRCVLAMRSMLVTTDCGRIILIDTGVGNKHLKKLRYYDFFDLSDLSDNLTEKEIPPEEITDVVLTHLHFDHCGYTTQYGTNGSLILSFPNATHWVSRAQWENCMQPNAMEKGSYFPENIIPVQESGKLALIDKDTNLCPSVDLRLYGGHTPGQIVPYIHTPEQTIVFAGDVIPLAASVSPEWISAYDTCPVISCREKIRMLEEVAGKHQQIVFCHDAYTPTL
jgi:glyoxylase-like metal-dependent hydrolase (beta-lactamase superfamily II)